MPATDYTVASTEQLLGIASRSRRDDCSHKQRLNQLSQLCTGTHRLRHERRHISNATVRTDDVATLGAQDHGRDIYFSPVEVTPGTAFLSNPLKSPSLLTRDSTVLTPSTLTSRLATLPSHPSSSTSSGLTNSSTSAEVSGLSLLPEDLNGLLEGLVSSSLVRCSLDDRYHRLITGCPSMLAHLTNSDSSLYSMPNKQFLCAGPQNIAPYFELTSGACSAVTILDGHDGAQRLKMSSYKPDLDMDSNGMSDATIAMSLETNKAVKLHVRRGQSACEPLRIALQIMNTTVNHKTGASIGFLSAEYDVTESFQRAVIAELAQHADLSESSIVLDASHGPESSSAGVMAVPDWADWMAFVDELQVIGETTALLDTLLTHLQSMSAETCTMQTLTLMSELSRICTSSTDCIVVRATPSPDGSNWQAWVLYISRCMATKLVDMDAMEGSPTKNRASRVFLRKVCGMVIGNAIRTEGYSVTGAEDLIHRFRCVPLFIDNEAMPHAWAVFVQPTFTHWQKV